MNRASDEVTRGQLDRTVNTLESEANLLALYVKDFLEQLGKDHKQSGCMMMRSNRLAMSMIPLLKDVVRYTALLQSNSRGVQKEKAP